MNVTSNYSTQPHLSGDCRLENCRWINRGKNRPLPITLIGDEAHLIPPFAGQGVNTRLKDAHILAGNLTKGKFEVLEDAIDDDEEQMFIYVNEAQLASVRNEIEIHQPNFTFEKFIH
jgi:tetracycline 11a-monooxygenase, tetracycline resistance protein